MRQDDLAALLIIGVITHALGVGYVMQAKGYSAAWYLIGLIAPPLGTIAALGMPLTRTEQATRAHIDHLEQQASAQRRPPQQPRIPPAT